MRTKKQDPAIEIAKRNMSAHIAEIKELCGKQITAVETNDGWSISEVTTDSVALRASNLSLEQADGWIEGYLWATYDHIAPKAI